MNIHGIALVTGASRGIGACVAQKLAQEKYHVLLNYHANEAQASEVLKAIQCEGGSAELCQFDVSSPEEVEASFERIAKHPKGALQVLVNNAGITIDALLIRTKNEDIEKTLAIDLKGAMYCTREASKQMLRRRQGSIIQISSVVGESGNPGQSAYAAAKAGLIGFSKSVAKELANRQIRVNVVSPGFIKTEMTESLTDAQKEAILRNVPLGFLGAPEDVASLVAFLASPCCRYITGQVIGVNGGMYM
jgi:3-oxoacyl-[acyl-carrier protein] reductase